MLQKTFGMQLAMGFPRTYAEKKPVPSPYKVLCRTDVGEVSAPISLQRSDNEPEFLPAQDISLDCPAAHPPAPDCLLSTIRLCSSLLLILCRFFSVSNW